MFIRRFSSVALLLVSLLYAGGDVNDWSFSAFGWYTFGYFPHAFYLRANPDKADQLDFQLTGEWVTDVLGGFRAERTFLENYKGRFSIALKSRTIQKDPEGVNVEFLTKAFGVTLLDAAVERTFNITNSSLKLEFGYFPVKYNPEASNLGEYLFRSTCYPTVVKNGFEDAIITVPKLLGFHTGLRSEFGSESNIKLDFYLTSDIEMYPLYDFSPALLFAMNVEKVFDFGLGWQGYKYIPVDNSKTTPGSDPNNLGTQQGERYVYYVKDTTVFPAVVLDTIVYSFKGTKLMGRFTFNPRKLIPLEILGENDLKVFAEVAILGLKNYTGWYEDWYKRMPIMFGFNLPAFKILDIFQIQLQYFNSDYWNSWENVWKSASPVPYVASRTLKTYEDWVKDEYDQSTKDVDNWKWSVYMSKKLNGRIRLSLQFARDNMSKQLYGPPPPTNNVYSEITREKQDWYWMARIMFYL